AFNRTAGAWIDACKQVENFHRAIVGRLERCAGDVRDTSAPNSLAPCAAERDTPSVVARSARPVPGWIRPGKSGGVARRISGDLRTRFARAGSARCRRACVAIIKPRPMPKISPEK